MIKTVLGRPECPVQISYTVVIRVMMIDHLDGVFCLLLENTLLSTVLSVFTIQWLLPAACHLPQMSLNEL